MDTEIKAQRKTSADMPGHYKHSNFIKKKGCKLHEDCDTCPFPDCRWKEGRYE